MAERWVINASPVILLGKAGVIHLLPDLCDELVVPAGVVAEVELGRMADAGRAWLDGDGGRFVHAAPPLHPAVAWWNGGAGEAEVISWALAPPGFRRARRPRGAPAGRLAGRAVARVVACDRRGEGARIDSAGSPGAGKIAGQRGLRERRIARTRHRAGGRNVSGGEGSVHWRQLRDGGANGEIGRRSHRGVDTAGRFWMAG